MFNHNSSHDTVTLAQVFLPLLQFPLSVSFQRCSIIIFISHVALTRRTNGELRNLPNAMLFRNSGSTKYKSTCTFLLVSNGSNRTKTVFPDRQRNQVTVLASRQSTRSAMQDRPTFLLLLQPQVFLHYTSNRQPSLSDSNLVLLWHVDVPRLKWCIWQPTVQCEWTIWPNNLGVTPTGLVWGRRSGGIMFESRPSLALCWASYIRSIPHFFKIHFYITLQLVRHLTGSRVRCRLFESNFVRMSISRLFPSCYVLC